MKQFVIPQAKPAGETPPAERKAAERARLTESGGKQIAINLPAEAAADLDHIRDRDGTSIKDAIIAALKRHARR